MKKLILIDGNAILHRGFHALPGLTNDKGELVNAVYGFFSMFLRVLEDQKPTHVIVCFDRPKPTFRKALYAGYQAHRPAMADGLAPQIGMLHDALERMQVAIFEVDGYEADDVIGTLAHQATASAEDLEVIIVTGDRDLLQLVKPQVKVLTPVVGLKETVLYDEAKVEEKFGITPAQFIDYKALIGDASDGYPGVTGIGPKTAVSLLQQYKTFENLYQHIAELPEKTAVKLATDAEQAALAKKLATIVTDAPVHFEITKCACRNLDLRGLYNAFEALGFKSLQKRIAADLKKQEEEKAKQLGLL
jgi:DNA polymerase I